MDGRGFTLEYYRSLHGDEPVRRWIDEDLSPAKRRAVMAAFRYLLATEGPGICGSEHGRRLGRGLFELRLRHEERVLLHKAGVDSPNASPAEHILIRVFCHAYGDRVVLILGGYDKGADPSPRRQQREISTARRRLADFRRRRRS